MNVLFDILNSNTRSQLEVFSSIPSVLTQIVSKTYSYTTTKTILEFATSDEYNQYITPSNVTIQPNIIKTINTSQVKKLIEYEVVTSFSSVTNDSYNCNYINKEYINTPLTINNILSYQYKAPLYLHQENYINNTKSVYRGILTQTVNVSYSVNNENEFYLLDKYSVLERNRFTYMPKDDDPFYAQKVILLEIYNAPTVDSNEYFRKNIINNCNSMIMSVLIFNTFAIIVSYICIINKNSFRNIIVILFFLVGLITIISSFATMIITNNYSYISFTNINKYIEDMKGFNTINGVTSLSWFIAMIVLIFATILFS